MDDLVCSSCEGMGIACEPDDCPGQMPPQCGACHGTGQFTQCSYGTGGDPASGCDKEAVEFDLCEAHRDMLYELQDQHDCTYQETPDGMGCPRCLYG